jgi:hypothetical protein
LNLKSDCTLQRLVDLTPFNEFVCREKDLNEFLKDDAIAYSQKLLGVTYVFTLDTDPKEIVCFFTVSNDGLKIEQYSNSVRRKVNRTIPYTKQMRNYPAVKIGRLGVALKYKGYRLGDQVMDFIKGWFSVSNKTGCRFLLVDAYNKPDVLTYYSRNGFQFLLAEQDEIQKDKEGNQKPLKTRLMFFDLIQLVRN